jgi:hypothetical protein
MGSSMTAPPPKRGPMAGGAPLALCIIGGPIVAAFTGHSTSLGFLVGLGAGCVIAVLIWLIGK